MILDGAKKKLYFEEPCICHLIRLCIVTISSFISHITLSLLKWKLSFSLNSGATCTCIFTILSLSFDRFKMTVFHSTEWINRMKNSRKILAMTQRHAWKEKKRRTNEPERDGNTASNFCWACWRDAQVFPLW